MIIEPPSILPAIQAVSDYAAQRQADLTQEHSEILKEIRRRLERLQIQAAELIATNNRMWEKQGFDVTFDAQTEEIVVSMHGQQLQRLKLNRADPNVPIGMGGMAASSGYHAGASKPSDEEEAKLRLELEEKLESYYQSAHRVLKLFGRIPELAKIKCDAVTRVRNNLIEHPADGALYSFGSGSTGPRVKPVHRGTAAYQDDGLVPNTRAFVDAIVAGCTPAAT